MLQAALTLKCLFKGLQLLISFFWGKGHPAECPCHSTQFLCLNDLLLHPLRRLPIIFRFYLNGGYDKRLLLPVKLQIIRGHHVEFVEAIVCVVRISIASQYQFFASVTFSSMVSSKPLISWIFFAKFAYSPGNSMALSKASGPQA